MPSELNRGIIRIASTYARMALGVVLGLLMVRLLLRSIGDDGFALTALLGQTVGFGAMVQDVVRYCMVRELGAAYHDKSNDRAFPVAISNATAVSAVVGLATVALFGVIFMILPLFQIPDHLMAAARWFVIAKAGQSLVITVLAPQTNMLLVAERMVAFNVWMLAQRAAMATAAAALVLWGEEIDPSGGVIAFGVLAAGLTVISQIAVVTYAVHRDRRLMPRRSLITWIEARQFATVGAWNLGVVVANNLHLRMHAIIMNVAFGLWGSRVFGLAAQLASYIRMVASGSSLGIDAVSARLQADDPENAPRQLVRYATRVTAALTLPCILGTMVLAEPILAAWVSSLLENPETEIPVAATIIRVLAIGIGAWGIGETWTRILYGLGHVRIYAPLVLVNGLLNPLGAVLLIWLLPESLGYLGPSLAFSISFVGIYIVAISIYTARVAGLRLRDLYLPMMRPAIAAIASTPAFLLIRLIEHWTLPLLILQIASYAVLYAPLCWWGVLRASERQQLARGLIRRLRR